MIQMRQQHSNPYTDNVKENIVKDVSFELIPVIFHLLDNDPVPSSQFLIGVVGLVRFSVQ